MMMEEDRTVTVCKQMVAGVESGAMANEVDRGQRKKLIFV